MEFGRKFVFPNEMVVGGSEASSDFHSIFEFHNGEGEKAKPEATADFQETFNDAVASGERVYCPKWRYPIRSLVDGLDAVSVEADTPVCLQGDGGAVIIPDPSFATVAGGSLFKLRAISLPTADGPIIPLAMRGITFDATQLTAMSGEGVGSGFSFFHIYRYHRPVFENCVFDGGLTTITGTGVGAGGIDAAINTHQTSGDRIVANIFRGFYDLAYYPSGDIESVTVGANPLATTNASPTVIITCTADTRPTTGQIVAIDGATAVGGLTIFGQYEVIETPSSTTFKITAAGNATSTATGGGSAVIINNVTLNQSYSTNMIGEDLLFENNRVWRCGNAISVKRNWRGFQARGNTIRSCVTGITVSDVGSPSAEGRIGTISENDLYRIIYWPIRVIGSPARIHHNRIQSWGRLLSDDGLTRAPDVGQIIPAIALRSARGSRCDHNEISQEIGTNWTLQDAPGSEMTVGVQIRVEPGYSTSIEQVQASYCSVDHNFIDYAQQGVREEEDCDYNYIGYNQVANWQSAVFYTNGYNTVVKEIIPAWAAIVIESGAITITHELHEVDTEASAATDDLTDILGGPVGSLLTLKGQSTARDVTIKHNAGTTGLGSIFCGSDFTFTSTNDTMTLRRADTTTWICIAKSDNA